MLEIYQASSSRLSFWSHKIVLWSGIVHFFLSLHSLLVDVDVEWFEATSSSWSASAVSSHSTHFFLCMALANTFLEKERKDCLKRCCYVCTWAAAAHNATINLLWLSCFYVFWVESACLLHTSTNTSITLLLFVRKQSFLYSFPPSIHPLCPLNCTEQTINSKRLLVSPFWNSTWSIIVINLSKIHWGRKEHFINSVIAVLLDLSINVEQRNV